MFVADKLKALEKEILKYPEGTITIKESGEIFMTMFSSGYNDEDEQAVVRLRQRSFEFFILNFN